MRFGTFSYWFVSSCHSIHHHSFLRIINLASFFPSLEESMSLCWFVFLCHLAHFRCCSMLLKSCITLGKGKDFLPRLCRRLTSKGHLWLLSRSSLLYRIFSFLRFGFSSIDTFKMWWYGQFWPWPIKLVGIFLCYKWSPNTSVLCSSGLFLLCQIYISFCPSIYKLWSCLCMHSLGLLNDCTCPLWR
jgi:hypothetical protein